MPQKNRNAFRLCALVSLCTAWTGSAARASSVIPMNLSSLADHAALVYVGRVASVESRWADGPRRIESEVAFEQVECLKGSLPPGRANFSLIVPGGTVGTTQMRICCAPTFRVGEKWLLFVLPSYRTFPVVGLWQGALRIEADRDGIERVLAASSDPVMGIDDSQFPLSIGRRVQNAHRHLVESHGADLAVPIARKDPARAISLSEFLETLRPILSRSRAHPLQGPIGRFVPAQQTAVPLKVAPQARAHSRSPERAGRSTEVRQATPGPTRRSPGARP